MSNKDALLKQLDDGYAALKGSFAGLGDAQMAQPWLGGTWGVREVLAHVAGWHVEMTGFLQRMARGERPTPEGVDYTKADEWNDQFVSDRKKLSPAKVVADLDASFAAFRSAAVELPEERFAPGRTGERIMHNTGTNHYAEHAEQIKKWRRGL